ncbi:hypothetical protein [Priestia megaterium]|nr:hypothetical protein [Priestia megaterium]
MQSKTDKANHIIMFETTGEFYAHEVTGAKENIGFFFVLLVR